MKKRNQKTHDKPKIFSIKKDVDKDNGTSRRKFVEQSLGVGTGIALASLTARDAKAQTQSAGGKVAEEMCDAVKAHSAKVMAIAISPDGSLLASASFDETIKIWSLPDGALLHTITDSSSTQSLVFSKDGEYLYMVGGGENLYIFRTSSGNLSRRKKGDMENFNLAINFDGTKLVASGISTTFQIWDLADNTVLKTLTGESDIVSMAFSKDDLFLAAGTRDNTINLYRLPDGQLYKTLEGHRGNVYFVKFTPDGSYLVSASSDRTVRIWSITQVDTALNRVPNEQSQDNLTPAALAAAAVAPGNSEQDGPNDIKSDKRSKFVAAATIGVAAAVVNSSCSDDNVASSPVSPDNKNTPEYNFELLKEMTGHTGNITFISISPDSTILATGSVDNTIKIWSLPDGTLLHTIIANEDDVNTGEISPDGAYLVSGGGTYFDSGTLKLWQMPDGKPHWCLMDADYVENQDCKTVSQEQQITDGTVCTCDMVCVCDTVTVPSGTILPGTIVCICDTVSVGNICTCDSVCTCDSHSSSCSSCSSCGYWYPN